jgi:AP2 domain./HNH endonuclease.
VYPRFLNKGEWEQGGGFMFGDGMKQIKLTQGKVAVVDDSWYDYLMQWKWYAMKQYDDNKWYALRGEGKWPHQTQIRMHRVIMGVTDPKIEVDHRNNNGLDNREENLRKCTHKQNRQNTKRHKDNLSGYKGVTYSKKSRNWQAAIAVNRKSIHLGLFETPVLAALAYDTAASFYFGEYAKLNFEYKDIT